MFELSIEKFEDADIHILHCWEHPNKRGRGLHVASKEEFTQEDKDLVVEECKKLWGY